MATTTPRFSELDEGLFRDDDPAYGRRGRSPRWYRTYRPAGSRPRVRPASGLLPHYRDAEGDWYLLGLRTLSLGGTWSNIGGSIDHGEDALASAAREFYEEVGLPVAVLGEGRVTHAVSCGTPLVPYTLFVVDVTSDDLDGFDLSWEHDDLAWFRADEVDDLVTEDATHAGFARAWLVLRAGLPA